MKQNKLRTLYEKDMTKKILASLLSILIGLVVGSVIIAAVGFSNPELGASSVWDGFRLVFAGLFSTGRTASGVLTWGFNSTNFGNMLFRATPLIMTGLSLAVLGGVAAGAVWGAIPGALKAFLNINEVLASIMTNWLAANLVTWMFDISNFKNLVENTKSGYIYKTTYNDVATAKLGLDKLFPNSQVNAGILVAILFAIAMYILMNKTTLGYELKACGMNRHSARYAGIRDKRNIVLSMAIAGGLAGGAAALYYLSGNTEFFWSTYQTLPAEGFNGIPVALLAVNNPIAVIFTAIFMSVLDIAGLQLTNLTAYNEYITDVIIAAIVYLSAFSLVIRMLLDGRKKKHKSGAAPADAAPVEPAQSLGDPDLHPDPAITDPDADAPVAEGGEQA